MTEEKGRDPHKTEKIVRLIEQDLTRLWKHVMQYYRRFPCESLDNENIQNYGSATFGTYFNTDGTEEAVARIALHKGSEADWLDITSRFNYKKAPVY